MDHRLRLRNNKFQDLHSTTSMINGLLAIVVVAEGLVPGLGQIPRQGEFPGHHVIRVLGREIALGGQGGDNMRVLLGHHPLHLLACLREMQEGIEILGDTSIRLLSRVLE